MEARTYIDERGRLVLPPTIKKHFNYKAGDKVILRTNENELHVISLNDALKEVQMAFKINEDDKKNMLNDFIASKRLEAKLEEERYNRTEENDNFDNGKFVINEGSTNKSVKDNLSNDDDKDNK